MPEPIRFRGVEKRYGSVTALADVDLTVEPGEFHCVVGPNGSGKTTLFALALGLVGPTSGTVERPAGGVGGSFQRPTFYPDLTAGENLRVWGMMAGADPAWRESLVDRLDLGRVDHRLAGDLSRGWQRRLEIALGLLKQPTYALMDEPLSGLDAPAKRHLRSYLADYVGPERSVVVATHTVDAFDPVVDRLTVLDRGRVQYHGPVDGETTASARYLAVFD